MQGWVVEQAAAGNDECSAQNSKYPQPLTSDSQSDTIRQDIDKIIDLFNLQKYLCPGETAVTGQNSSKMTICWWLIWHSLSN